MSQMSVDPVRAAAIRSIRELLKRHEIEADSPETVHQIRVCTKILRAYLRVYPAKTGIHHTNRKLKSIADTFSESRDQHVLNETVSRLVVSWSARKRKKYQLVIDHFKIPRLNVTHQTNEFNLRSAFEDVLLGWPQRVNEPMFWVTGLDIVFIKAQKLGMKAQKGSNDEAFHVWRKWVKYWLYGLSDIARGKVPSAYRKGLKRLAEALGYFHDLCVLETALKDPVLQQKYGASLPPFLKAINVEKKGLKKSFKKANKSLFKINYRKRFKMVAKPR